MGYKKQLSWFLIMVFVRYLKRVFQLGQCCKALAGVMSSLGTALYDSFVGREKGRKRSLNRELENNMTY